MRVLKFRAWDGTRIYYPDQIIQALGDESCTTGYYDDSGCPKGPSHTLMQYTGLKDRNGVEIYEGDIVQYRYAENDHVYSIGWDSVHCNFGFCEDEKIYGVHAEDIAERTTVIGNIHEHPELITP